MIKSCATGYTGRKGTLMQNFSAMEDARELIIYLCEAHDIQVKESVKETVLDFIESAQPPRKAKEEMLSAYIDWNDAIHS